MFPVDSEFSSEWQLEGSSSKVVPDRGRAIHMYPILFRGRPQSRCGVLRHFCEVFVLPLRVTVRAFQRLETEGQTEAAQTRTRLRRIGNDTLAARARAHVAAQS